MAVAYDATSGTTFTTTDPVTFTHTPVGTPRGVLLFVLINTGSDLVNGAVTYGGVAMTAVPGAAAVDSAGEPLYCKTYFLGSSIPTGAQTVSVDHTGSSDSKFARCITVTAAADTEVVGTPVLLQGDGTVSEQNVDSGAADALRFAALAFGGGIAPGAGANSTSVASGTFAGGLTTFRVVRETTGGTGSRPVGISTGTNDDRAGVHLAIAESGGGGAVTRTSMVT